MLVNDFSSNTREGIRIISSCVPTLTGLAHYFFCSISGSINKTKSNFSSKNFFFSFAHIENTCKSAFLMFLLDEHARCFENFEKRS